LDGYYLYKVFHNGEPMYFIKKDEKIWVNKYSSQLRKKLHVKNLRKKNSFFTKIKNDKFDAFGIY